MNVGDKKAYKRFNNFRQRVLNPALEEINDFGTVNVTMIPLKVGRSVSRVKFKWDWKSISEARETDEENARLKIARRKTDTVRDMPPLSGNAVIDPPEFEHKQTPEERAKIAEEIMRDSPFKRK
jgi:plasmid replication initiation protein